MEKHNEQLDDEFIDLGSVTGETHGTGGSLVPDTPQERRQTGILPD